MKQLFSAEPIWQRNGILLLRIITAALIIYHGWEIFDAEKMKGYTEWDQFKTNTVMPYLGKGAELVAGLLLLAGLCTRLSCILLIGTFGYITFFVGNGKFWYEDQHPFLFVLLGLFFFITGPGAISVDAMLCKKNISA
jgi:putative oxidoreductase